MTTAHGAPRSVLTCTHAILAVFFVFGAVHCSFLSGDEVEGRFGRRDLKGEDQVKSGRVIAMSVEFVSAVRWHATACERRAARRHLRRAPAPLTDLRCNALWRPEGFGLAAH